MKLKTKKSTKRNYRIIKIVSSLSHAPEEMCLEQTCVKFLSAVSAADWWRPAGYSLQSGSLLELETSPGWPASNDKSTVNVTSKT